jgi:DnaJ-class molecular chaperone
VRKYIDGLWQQFNQVDEHTRARHMLNIEAGADIQEVTRNYRQLISKHHPDKGGDQDTFISIRQAYELLRQQAA